MEYLTVLSDYYKNHLVTIKDVLKMGQDVAAGLTLCHSMNIIHRDIKESNIFINSNGTYKLGDFGVAKVLGEASNALSMKGTEAYIAPEIYLHQNYNKTVDIYSLGIVLYKMMNMGRQPFLPFYPESYHYKDEDLAIVKRLRGDPIPPLQNCSSTISEVILKACAYQQEDRYQTIEAFYADILLLMQELSDDDLKKVISPLDNVDKLSGTRPHQNTIQTVTWNDNINEKNIKKAKAKKVNKTMTLIHTLNKFKGVQNHKKKEAKNNTKDGKNKKAAKNKKDVKEFNRTKLNIKRALIIIPTVIYVVVILFLSIKNNNISILPPSKSKINVGNYVQFGTYNEKVILWKCVEKDPSGSVMLLSEKILCEKAFDAAENGIVFVGSNSEQRFGSNLWNNSNIREWLNSETEVVTYSTTPPKAFAIWWGTNHYENEPGFLYHFSKSERNKILSVPHGKVSDKVYLLSDQEIGLSGNKSKNSTWWTRTPKVDTSSIGKVRFVDMDGSLELGDPCSGSIGVLPALNLKSDIYQSGKGTVDNPFVVE